MKLRAVVALAALVLAMAASVYAAAIDGSWTSDFSTPIGDMHYTYTFKTDGDKVVGTAKSGNGESTLQNVVVSGDDISFTENLDVQGMTIAIDYKGKISGDEIKFTRHIGSFGDDETVAKRVK
jgi:hypothetical protein